MGASIEFICVDLGTTWAKVARVAVGEEARTSIRARRDIPSIAGTLDGTPAAINRLLLHSAMLIDAIRELSAGPPPAAIGVCGVREGIVVLDGVGRVLWVSGNGAIDPAASTKAVDEARSPTLMSLQGYVAFRLTGVMGISDSEVHGLGLEAPASGVLDALPLRGRNLATNPLKVGAVLAYAHGRDRLPVFLAGYDEHAASHGAWLGQDCDAMLNMASYWGVMGPELARLDRCAAARNVAECGLYQSYGVVVGYRWGLVLRDLIEHSSATLPEQTPRWATGRLVAALRAQTKLGLDDAVALMRDDLRDAMHELWGTNRRAPRVSVFGGAARHFRREVTSVLPPEWNVEFIAGDASLAGIARLGRAICG